MFSPILSQINTVLSRLLVVVRVAATIYAVALLATTGEWKLILFGIGAVVFSWLGLLISSLPGIIRQMLGMSRLASASRRGGEAEVAREAEKFGEQFDDRKLLNIFLFAVVQTFVCIAFLSFFMEKASAHSLAPALILSFCALAWAIGTLKHPVGNSPAIATFGQLAYFLTVIATLNLELSFTEATLVLSVLMFVGTVLSMAEEELRKRKWKKVLQEEEKTDDWEDS